MVWYSVDSLDTQARQEIKTAFKEANYFWIALSVILGVISHISRAVRWKIAIKPLGYKIKTINAVAAVYIGYFTNLIFPRAGEFSRAAAIQQTETIPFDQAFGTIITERAIDLIMLFLVALLALGLQTDYILDLLKERIPNDPYQILLLLGLFTVILSTIIWLVYKSNNSLSQRLKKAIKGLLKGLSSIARMQQKWLYIFHSFFIWFLYLAMFYVATLSIEATSSLPLSAITTGFIVGSLSIAATNGGIGSYPLGIQQAMKLYGVPAIAGLSFGWIMWSTQTLMMILLGGLSFLFLKRKPKTN